MSAIFGILSSQRILSSVRPTKSIQRRRSIRGEVFKLVLSFPWQSDF